MYNKWKKIVAIIVVAGIFASIPETSGYAQEVEQNVIGEGNIPVAEISEGYQDENRQAVPNEDTDIVKESSTNFQESDAIETQSDLPEEEIDVEGDVNDQTPSEAEKNDMANSWRFKNGERIVQDQPMSKARSARTITPWTNINGIFYNSMGEVIEGVVAKGIDVSQWNGDVDWATVKNTDVDYAIIRCGYGMDQTNQDDLKWKRNADACTAYDIPFGVYIYSYADTVERAVSEAKHVLRLVKGYNLSYPIYYDLEETAVRKSVSKSGIAEIAKAFCDTIEAAGYRVGIYANTDWFTNYLTDPVFNNWTRWVAQWNYECTYTGSYKMWQCTDNGRVNGISGAVDLNMDFGTVDNKRLVVKDGVTYCYSGNTQLFGEQKVNGLWYFFDESAGGAMVTGFHDFTDKRVYYGENGAMLYGEQKIDGKWYCFDTVTGAMKTGMYQFPDKKVYYGNDGSMLFGLQAIEGKSYYFDTCTGAMLYGEQKIGGKWYYFEKETGVMQTGFYDLSKKRVFYGTDGAMRFGEHKINGKWYYFDTTTGEMKKGFYQLPGKKVYYGADGAMRFGEQTIDGKKYYFDSIDGTMKIGFVQNEEGETKYYSTNGTMVYGEQKIGGKWYYFEKETGVMQTGFYDLSKKRVYYGTDGAMRFGEQKIGGKWYYFDTTTGEMKKGFYQLPGKKVYYGTDGAMLFGPQKINNNWYAFDRVTGAMVTNKFFEGYYYGSDGVRQK